MVNRFLHATSYWLLPGRCVSCSLPSKRHLDLCQHCEALLPWQHHCCRSCALPLAGANHPICGECLSAPPAFTRCVTPWLYQPPLNQLISAFKYRRRLETGRVLSRLALPYLQHAYRNEPWPHWIVPTPLHWRRRITRRFNQSEYVARDWANELQLPLSHALKRQRATVPQQSLSANARKRNLRGVFTASPEGSMHIRGATIAVVDDVVTTGSTANALAKVLLNAGAKEIHIWALARTP